MTKIVRGYTAGAFDMFHIGHLKILREAKLYCSELIVGVTTDELLMDTKKLKPIIPFEERIEIIRSIKYVDEAIPQSVSDKTQAYMRLKFHEIYVGDDWKGSETWNNYELIFNSMGVKVRYFPYTQHISSSKLRDLLKQYGSI